MKFKDKDTGAILEPSDALAPMFEANERYEKLAEEKPKAAPRKRAAKPKE